jgi:hypothetical protein
MKKIIQDQKEALWQEKNLKRKYKFKRLQTRIGERSNHIFASGQMTSETFLALFPISLITNNIK